MAEYENYDENFDAAYGEDYGDTQLESADAFDYGDGADAGFEASEAQELRSYEPRLIFKGPRPDADAVFELPEAHSPSLVDALLRFDAEELCGEDDIPAHVLIAKAAEIKGWKVKAQHPRYLINRWVELTVSSTAYAHCRLLNSRTHIHLRPLCLEQLFSAMDKLKQEFKRYTTPRHRLADMTQAYDQLMEEREGTLPLHELFLYLQKRSPRYRREEFAIDFYRLVEQGVLDGRPVHFHQDADAPAKDGYLIWVNNSLKRYHSIELEAQSELQALNI